MVTFKLKSGEIKQIEDEDMLTFLEQNRELIEIQHSERKRKILGDYENAEYGKH